MNLRNILAKTHWLIGITLGTFLAISGLTGGLMAFGPELTNAATGANRMVQSPGGDALPMPVLYEKLLEEAGDARITGLTLYGDPSRYVSVELSSAGESAPGPGGPAPTRRLANPYTGELLPESKLGKFVDSVNRGAKEIHQGHWFGPSHPLTFIPRWGFALATFLLFFIALSGLYLRWPKGRSARTWRGWFKVNTKLKGRAFLFNLHSVVGTFVLLMYLVSAHTGTMQAAPMRWYNNSVRVLLGLPPMEEPGRPPGGEFGGPGGPGGPPVGPGGPGEFRGPGGPSGGPGQQQGPAPQPADIAPLFDNLYASVPDFEQATLQLGMGRPSLMYEAAGSRGRIGINAETGAAEALPMDERRPPGGGDTGERSFAQILVERNEEIHEGRIFGVAGVSVMMVAGFAMPVFYVTGWMMYLKRRKRERSLKQKKGES